ncbi:MAG TPA: response regulator transcription factor [Thermoanaerobaculia bacterium]|jgi:DNA-binding response OmpR family regulator|nr:response regulator transcription factor [Thermoanaerobaculia bacterium]
MKILVVDDDQELLGLVAYALRQASYMVVEASDGAAALATFEREEPSLVVLDVNLPKLSGLEVCRKIRESSGVPVMMLTVRSAEEDQVQALDLGADDYLTKPFSPRTLLARVRALLRRAGSEKPAPLAAGDFTLDLERQCVTIAGGTAVRLTNLEVRLLQLLLANAGHTLPAERLLSHVWGSRGAGDRQILKQLVHRLRQKIEMDAADPRYLVTVAGVGYAFRPEGGGEVE